MPQALDDAVLARKMWRTLEPLHGMVYFAPEAPEEYARLGFEERRAATSPPAPRRWARCAAEVVIATFFNFHPDLVRRHVPKVWAAAPPARIVDGALPAWPAPRSSGCSAPRSTAPEMAEAATLAAPGRARLPARGTPPLRRARVAVAGPTEPHLVLWHAITLLREYRGDGHVAVLTSENVSACEALVLHAAAGEVPAATLRASRAWS